VGGDRAFDIRWPGGDPVVAFVGGGGNKARTGNASPRQAVMIFPETKISGRARCRFGDVVRRGAEDAGAIGAVPAAGTRERRDGGGTLAGPEDMLPMLRRPGMCPSFTQNRPYGFFRRPLAGQDRFGESGFARPGGARKRGTLKLRTRAPSSSTRSFARLIQLLDATQGVAKGHSSGIASKWATTNAAGDRHLRFRVEPGRRTGSRGPASTRGPAANSQSWRCWLGT